MFIPVSNYCVLTSERHHGFTNQGHHLLYPLLSSNHNFILQPFLVQYPSGWGSLSLHRTIQSHCSSYQNTDHILNTSEKKRYKLHYNKKHKKEQEKSIKSAWQFGDEQGVPGHIVPVCLRIMDWVYYCPHLFWIKAFTKEIMKEEIIFII